MPSGLIQLTALLANPGIQSPCDLCFLGLRTPVGAVGARVPPTVVIVPSHARFIDGTDDPFPDD
ncbi:hypothetical protein BMF89_07705 [Arthrobacter sp. SRS-W-1-2016]|uniref:hypothetical protein n=1 Tax=Arthrobacter sp. SRS-W-1-2016 TaxID=1930254 RepID=UPI000990B7A7|nr:hypothetical protein [Arthrobacter sp. SRS-W-1-2016]OOP63082.1 hypothetical protein BMF89_07705 [Arthrobacter sp. SRS-W-1-2016]